MPGMSSAMIGIDTNILLRLIVGDEPANALYARAWDEIKAAR